MNNWAKLIKFFIYTILFSLVASYSMALSSDWSVGETSKLRLISAYSQNDSKNFMIGLEYQMDPGWKTYWKSPGDGGFAQSISWENSTNVKNVNILWPTPIEFEILGLTSLGYQNDIIFPLEIELEDELKNTFLNLHITFLICNEICIPGDATIFLEIPSGEKKLTNKQIKELKDYIKNWNGKNNLIFVTHFVVISEIINLPVSSGEIIITDKDFKILIRQNTKNN